MPELKSLLTTVRKDLHTIGHRRNAYSLSHPYSPMHDSNDNASTGALSEPTHDHDSEEMTRRCDTKHTGTSTCACQMCLMPGNLTKAEFEQHVARKIEAGRRELTTVDEQLDHANELLKLLNDIDEKIRRLAEEPTNKPLPTPPIQDCADATPTPRTRRRMTIQELPATPFAATRPTTRCSQAPASATYPSHERDAWTVVDSPNSAKHMGMVFQVPDRISSLETALQEASEERPSTSSRLSKPFPGHWPNQPSPAIYSSTSLEFDDEIFEEAEIREAHTELLYRPTEKPEVVTTFTMREGDPVKHSPERPKSTKKYNMPPSPIAVPRFTPRTESTADLLGGPVMHKMVSRDADSPKSPPAFFSTFKDRNKGGLSLKSSTSIESAPSMKKKWNMFRTTSRERPHTTDANSPFGGSGHMRGLSYGCSVSSEGSSGRPSSMMTARPAQRERRHSKADILLGITQSQTVSRMGSAMGWNKDSHAASIIGGPSKGKRGFMGRFRRSRD